MTLRSLLCLLALSFAANSQNESFPLEAVKIEGSQIANVVVLEMTGLHIGASVNQVSIEEGCKKLQASGLFQTVGFHYQPGPKNGYVLTLSLIDQTALLDASIDVPGLDDHEIWQWLVARYPSFQHKVPSDGSAQQFLARQIELHLGAKLEGQHLIAGVESDLTRHKTMVSFQPETLPKIAAMNFTGQHEFSEADLVGIMEKVAVDQGYLDRRFRAYVEMNLRRAYEEHGMYRVRFPSIVARKADASTVAVTTTIEEGPKYTLGDVRLLGDNLPAAAMLEAAKFKTGSLANWTEIQQGVRETEKPLRRLGYRDATAVPERVYRDEQHILDLKVSVLKGPVHHFGQLQLTGLTPDLEAKARKMWKLQPGDPYDYAYPNDFLWDFVHSLRNANFKRFDADTQKGSGDHVVDVSLTFVPK